MVEAYEVEEAEGLINERVIIVEKPPDGRFERLNDEISTQAFKAVYRGIDSENGNEVAWNIVKVMNIPKIEKHKVKSELHLIKKL